MGGPAQMIQVLQQLVSSLSQLSQGWGGLLGLQPYGYGAQQGNVPNFLATGTTYGATATPVTTTTGGGLYGSGTSNTGSLPAMNLPSDGNDYASYLQAQVAGGALNGQTTVNQSDGIPGTRFATVAPSQLWNANVGRLYAYQFAAQATGSDPLSAQGLQAGAQAMQQMSPDAQMFMQVASVFKGNLNGGPGNYDNAGLKQLLIRACAGDLTTTTGVRRNRRATYRSRGCRHQPWPVEPAERDRQRHHRQSGPLRPDHQLRAGRPLSDGPEPLRHHLQSQSRAPAESRASPHSL